MKKIMILVLVMVFLVGSVVAIKNPSAVYCEEMGYEFTISYTVEGDEKGMCNFPDGTFAEAWEFVKGKKAKKHSYCEKKGYELRTITDPVICSSIYSYECAVCIKDGKKNEVTKLMKLNFKEGVCGDGFCNTLEENYKKCSEDCASGSEDDYCDKVEDGICDPDCKEGKDPDCPSESLFSKFVNGIRKGIFGFF